MKTRRICCSKFRPWIRVIAVILAIVFLWQDIVWAHPDVTSRSTLAPEALVTGADKAAVLQKVGFRYIAEEIHRNTASLELTTVRDIWWPFLLDLAGRYSLKPEEMPEISDISDFAVASEGLIKIAFSTGYEIIFYDPKIEKSRLRAEKERRAEGTASSLNLPVNDYLSVLFIAKGKSLPEKPEPQAAETEPPLRPATAQGRFGKVTDEKLRQEGKRYCMIKRGGRRAYFHFRWNIFASLEDQILGNIEEREWIDAASERIGEIREKLAEIKGITKNLSGGDRSEIKATLSAIQKVLGSQRVQNEPKQHAAARVIDAKASLAEAEAEEDDTEKSRQSLRDVYSSLWYALKYLAERKKQIEDIYENSRRILKEARAWAEEMNSYMAGSTQIKGKGALYALANRDEIKAPENEPECEGLEPLIREAIRDPGKRDENLRKVREEIGRANYLNRAIAEFKDAYFDARYLGWDESRKRELFKEKWTKYLGESGVVRGSPDYWYARFYQAAFIHRTVANPEKPSERISKPLFEASTALIQVLKIRNFDLILRSHSALLSASFPETRKLIKSSTKKSVDELSKREKRNLVRTLARDKGLGRAGLIALNKCAENFLDKPAQKKRPDGAGLSAGLEGRDTFGPNTLGAAQQPEGWRERVVRDTNKQMRRILLSKKRCTEEEIDVVCKTLAELIEYDQKNQDTLCNYADALIQKAEITRQPKFFRQALEHARELLRAYPNSNFPRGYYLMARAYYGQRRSTRALEANWEGLNKNPGHMGLLRQRVLIFSRTKRYRDTIAACNEYLKINPDSTWARDILQRFQKSLTKASEIARRDKRVPPKRTVIPQKTQQAKIPQKKTRPLRKQPKAPATWLVTNRIIKASDIGNRKAVFGKIMQWAEGRARRGAPINVIALVNGYVKLFNDPPDSERLESQLKELTDAGRDRSPEARSDNLAFGEGVGARHMQANNIIAFHPMTIVRKGKYYEREFYEREIPQEGNEIYNAKIRGAIECLESAGGEYAEKARRLERDVTIILVDLPTHLLLGGTGRNGKPFYQLTHLGRKRRIIFVPKKALDNFDISSTEDMRQLATILNHDQTELDLIHEYGHAKISETLHGYGQQMDRIHEIAKQDDPFGKMRDVEKRITGWLGRDESTIESLRDEIESKEGEFRERKRHIEGISDDSLTPSYMDGTALLAIQIAYAYQVLEKSEKVEEYYEYAKKYFREIVMTDVAFLPIFAQLDIIRILIFEGDYNTASEEFESLVSGEVGMVRAQEDIPLRYLLVSGILKTKIKDWLYEITSLLRNHAEDSGNAKNIEEASRVIKDMESCVKEFLAKQPEVDNDEYNRQLELRMRKHLLNEPPESERSAPLDVAIGVKDEIEAITHNAEEIVNVLINALRLRARQAREDDEEIGLLLDMPPELSGRVKELINRCVIKPMQRVNDNNGYLRRTFEKLTVYERSDIPKIKRRIFETHSLKDKNLIIVTGASNLDDFKEFKNAFITALDLPDLKSGEKLDEEDYYFPHIEETFFALLRVFGCSRDELWQLYTKIPNVDTETVDKEKLMEMCFFPDGTPRPVVKLKLRKISKFKHGDLQKIYERITEFIQSA